MLPDRLRFDFSHGKGVEPGEVQQIEQLCVEHIGRDLEVFSKETALADARNIHGELRHLVRCRCKLSELCLQQSSLLRAAYGT